MPDTNTTIEPLVSPESIQPKSKKSLIIGAALVVIIILLALTGVIKPNTSTNNNADQNNDQTATTNTPVPTGPWKKSETAKIGDLEWHLLETKTGPATVKSQVTSNGECLPLDGNKLVYFKYSIKNTGSDDVSMSIPGLFNELEAEYYYSSSTAACLLTTQADGSFTITGDVLAKGEAKTYSGYFEIPVAVDLTTLKFKISDFVPFTPNYGYILLK
jgi:hypothetical protein